LRLPSDALPREALEAHEQRPEATPLGRPRAIGGDRVWGQADVHGLPRDFVGPFEVGSMAPGGLCPTGAGRLPTRHAAFEHCSLAEEAQLAQLCPEGPELRLVALEDGIPGPDGGGRIVLTSHGVCRQTYRKNGPMVTACRGGREDDETPGRHAALPHDRRPPPRQPRLAAAPAFGART